MATREHAPSIRRSPPTVRDRADGQAAPLVLLRRLKPGILSRYILRLHVAPFIFGTVAITSMMLLNEVAKRFGDLVGKGLHWTVIAEVFLLSVPFLLAMTLPMSVLVAVLYTFNRLASDNEISAMTAGGVSMPRLLMPLCLAAFVLAGGMVWFNNSILPESNHKLQVLLTSIARKKPTFVLRERAINEVVPAKLFLRVARIDRDRSTLEDVVLYDGRDPGRPRLIYADSGAMAYNPAQTDLYLTLHSGVNHEREREQDDEYQRMYFDKFIMRISDISNELERDDIGRSDREMKIGQMKQEAVAGGAIASVGRESSRLYARELVGVLLGIDVPIADSAAENAADTAAAPAGGPDDEAADSARASPNVARMNAERARQRANQIQTVNDAVKEFQAYGSQLRTGSEKRSRFMVEIHKKFSIPAACIVFVLIGAPIAIRHPRGGIGMVVAVSFAFFCAYYVALIGGEELADRLILSPFFSMWAPNLLFGVVGLLAIWRAIHLER